MLDLSVIVPTYNRKSFLPPLLESLAAQDYPAGRWELVVVDDGSQDGTREYLEAYNGPRPANMVVVSQPNGSVATARNTGVREARGQAVLFLDDDMIASPSLVAEHAKLHLDDPWAVVLGRLQVPEKREEAWIAWEDAQLMRHYDDLNSGRRIPGPRDFFTGNCSVSADLFRSVGGFDKSLPRNEDLELGYRLQEAGARFYYRHAAVSLHLGLHKFEGWLRTARLYGKIDVHMAWEKGHTELQEDMVRWFNTRRWMNKALVQACLKWPAAQGATITALHALGRAAHKLGARKVSLAAYSAINNVAYWLGVVEALGDARKLKGKESMINPEIVKLQAVVDRFAEGRGTLKVLEAGCGSNSHIDLGRDTYVVGIDISEKQLNRNPLLKERILGDLQTYDLSASEFDLIVCWDVLEHLPEPEKAVRNFMKAIKDDGLIILAMPNLFSVKGLVTKLTPHRFHIWVWRYLYGNKLAGKDDHGPFPTFLRLSIAPPSMRRFAHDNGLAVRHFSMYEPPAQRKLREKYKVTGSRLALIKKAAKLLSLGRVDAELTDYIIVLSKKTESRKQKTEESFRPAPSEYLETEADKQELVPVGAHRSDF